MKASPDSPATDRPSPPSMVGRFFRHGTTYAVSGILSQGIVFLLFPFLAHVFSPRDFGIIDLIAVVTTLVNLTIALEISQGLGRHLADARAIEERRAYASTAFVFTVAVYTTGLLISLAFVGPLTSLVLGEDVDPTIMAVGVCAMWCSGMLTLTQSVLRWQLRPVAYGAVAVATAAVAASTTVVLVFWFDSGVIGAVAGQLAGFGAGAALAYLLSRDLLRMRFDVDKFRGMLAFSLPLVPASIGVFLNGYADRIAIRSQATLHDVGLYGVGYRLSLVVSLTLLGFQGALLPLVLAHHERDETRLDLARIFRIFVAIACAVFLCVSLFADELLRVLTSPAFYSATVVVPFLIAGSFLAGMYIFAPGPSIARQTRPYLIVALASGVTNAVLAFALVGPLGIRGPAIGFLLASAGSFIALMAVSQRFYPVPHAWRELALAAAAAAAFVLVGRSFLAGAPTLLSVVAKIGLTALGLAVIARLLLSREELAELWRWRMRSTRILRSTAE